MVDKINLSNFIDEVSVSMFQINRGLMFTIKELFVRPGHGIRDYLDGKRKNYFKPIAYAFTLSTIYFLLSQLVENETFVSDFLTGYSNGSTGSDEEADQLVLLKWLAKNYSYTILLLLPVYSLASYMAFRGAAVNYLEHCVLNAYITGQQALIYILSALISVLTGNTDLLIFLTLMVSVFYAFLVFLQFFSDKSRLGVILRSSMAYLLSLMILMVTLGLIFFVSQAIESFQP